MARASEKQLGRWSARAKETKSLVAKWARTMEMALEKTMGLRLALMQDRGLDSEMDSKLAVECSLWAHLTEAPTLWEPCSAPRLWTVRQCNFRRHSNGHRMMPPL